MFQSTSMLGIIQHRTPLGRPDSTSRRVQVFNVASWFGVQCRHEFNEITGIAPKVAAQRFNVHSVSSVRDVIPASSNFLS